MAGVCMIEHGDAPFVGLGLGSLARDMIVGFGASKVVCPAMVVRTPGFMRALYWPMEFWGRQFSVGVKMPSWPVFVPLCDDEGAGCCEVPEWGK